MCIDWPHLRDVDIQDVLIAGNKVLDLFRHCFRIYLGYGSSQCRAYILVRQMIVLPGTRNDGNMTQDVRGGPGTGIDMKVELLPMSLGKTLKRIAVGHLIKDIAQRNARRAYMQFRFDERFMS